MTQHDHNVKPSESAIPDPSLEKLEPKFSETSNEEMKPIETTKSVCGQDLGCPSTETSKKEIKPIETAKSVLGQEIGCPNTQTSKELNE